MGTEPESVGSSPEELTRQIRNLQERVCMLETRAGIGRVAPGPQRSLHRSFRSPLRETASLVPLFGKALLGLAAAYMLRALSEFGGAAVGRGRGHRLRAGLALAGARQAEADPRAAAVRVVTSVLIVVPVLREAQVGFHAMSSWATAVLLAAFSITGLLISWRKNLTVIAWISTLAGLVSGSALLVATRDLLPFTAAHRRAAFDGGLPMKVARSKPRCFELRVLYRLPVSPYNL